MRGFGQNALAITGEGSRANRVMDPGEIKARYSALSRPGWEVLGWKFYHDQGYAAAGQAQLVFFQSPKGQGGITAQDTNFPGAGSLPAGQNFMLEEVQLDFQPGVNPGFFGAEQAPFFLNDTWTFGRSGWLEFTVMSKKIIQEGPLGSFVPDHRLVGSLAVHDPSTIAANQQTLMQAVQWGGRLRRILPTPLEATTNFDITLFWNAALALPSGVAGRVGAIMAGKLYRKPQ